MIKRLLILIVFCMGLVGLWFQASKIQFDNYEWLAANNPDQKNKDYVKSEFDPGEDLVIGLSLRSDFFSKENVDALDRLTEKLKQIENVNSVETPLSATIIKGKGDVINIETYKEALDEVHFQTIEDYEDHLRSSYYWGRLISEDARHISIIMNCDINPSEFNYFKRDLIIKRAQNEIKALPWAVDYHLSGELQLSHQMDIQTKDNLKWLLQLSVVLVLGFLYIVFRNAYKILIVAASASVTVLSTVVIVTLRGHPLTAVSLILPVVIIVIAIADSIHILTRWNILRQSIPNDKELLKETIRETWLPCLVTSITTGIGFGAFYFSEIIPLQYFGTDAFVTVFVAYLLIITVSWGGIYVFQKQLHRSDHIQTKDVVTKFLLRVNNWTQKYWKIILIVSIVLTLFFASMLRNIYTETNFLDVFFKKKSEIYKSFTYIDYKLGGSGNVDIILQSDQVDFFKQVNIMNKVKSLQESIEKHPLVNYTQSYLNPVQMVHEEFTNEKSLPSSDEALSQELLFLEFSRGEEEKDVLSEYVDFDYKNARIHLQTPNISANETKYLLKFLDKELIATDFPGYVYAGSSVFFKALSGYILETQLLSIAVTLSVIWIVFVIIFGFKLGTLGMIPNIVPITFTLGLIAFLNIPFDFATVLISSISFGICVDDSIHFIHYYKWEKSKGVPFEERTRLSVQVLGYPIMMTTILLGLGFGVFMTADLVLLIKFGAFTVFAIVIALIADLIVLPAALRVFDNK